jgi:hypothetical protein
LGHSSYSIQLALTRIVGGHAEILVNVEFVSSCWSPDKIVNAISLKRRGCSDLSAVLLDASSLAASFSNEIRAAGAIPRRRVIVRKPSVEVETQKFKRHSQPTNPSGNNMFLLLWRMK